MQVERVDFIPIPTQDVERAKRFYGETLGLELADEGPGFVLALNGGARPTFVYPRPGHVPAEYTILNFDVADVEKPRPGLYAISAHYLAWFRKLEALEGADSDWLEKYTPIDRVGESIYIYRIGS